MLELLRQKTRLTDEEARPILLQLLAVVEYLHTNHVIHRDLKLGNLFLKQGPIIKLGDFGLATLVYGENDRKRTICGTPNYIAPEILAGGEKGHSYEVDIWSFGVIMYTILVGHPPFQRQEVKEIYEKIKVANFEFPKNVPISLSAQDLINRLLHPNPEMRPKISDIRAHSYFSGEAPSPILKATRRELIGILEPIEGAKNVTSSESGLIFSIQQSIRKILTNYSSVTSQFDSITYFMKQLNIF
jgi:cell cycle serine/threonine-protein kinase CDC5/MSD2